MEQKEQGLWSRLRGYFNTLPDKEDEKDTIQQISNGVSFRGGNLWVLIFAIFIASLGLNLNSTAVIIGAMLISPLMGPIIGMGLAVGINDFELLKRSLKNYLVATIISVLTATIYFSITPLNEAQSELLSRTSPTLYDVLVALFGGAAGILALATKGKGNVLPGVAIATALMPPLCTAGYGLAVGELSYFFGAFYLFFINTVFIALATVLGVRMLRFKHKEFIDPKRLKRVRKYMILVAVLTMLPATYMTILIIRESVLESNVRRFIKEELATNGTQILSQSLDKDKHTINIVAVGKAISPETISQASGQLKHYYLDGYQLHLIQGTESDSLLSVQKELLAQSTNQAVKATNRQLLEQTAQIHQLTEELQRYSSYDSLGRDIAAEVRAICPKVRRISLSRVSETSTDSTAHNLSYVVAIAGCRQALSKEEHTRLSEWLAVRSKADSLRLITTE